MTETDEPRVLLLADAWCRGPTHSIPPSSRRSHKRMGTSDWPLPRVTSIAQAGGAARCSSAVAMAADKLLSWMQGSRYSVHLCDKHPQHGFIKKNKGGLFVILGGRLVGTLQGKREVWFSCILGGKVWQKDIFQWRTTAQGLHIELLTLFDRQWWRWIQFKTTQAVFKDNSAASLFACAY